MEKTIHDPIHLPPGFRFHPSDEELITHYLSHKAITATFTSIAIGEADLNKVEPWELPWRAKMGEKEWYFFCMRDRKYPTGMRTNRATREGYWKATGKDKAIFRAESLVGMKKTLVFYRGRAPSGVKTNWVMHEFRLEGKQNLIKSSQNEWVICKVFMKTIGGKKVHISSLISHGSGSESSVLPPLTEFSSEVSNEMCLENNQEKLFEDLNFSLSFSFPFPQISTRNSGFSSLIKNTSTGDSAMVDLDCWDYSVSED